MNKLKLHIILSVFAFLSLNVFAQNHTKGYKIENDTVIFKFDVRDYHKFTKERTGKQLEFDDFDIYRVAVSGEFNNWSREGWNMQKLNDNIYELRKSVSDFNDAFTWEFKYVINNEYWAEPSWKDGNITKAIKNGKHLRGIYNLKMYTAYPSKNGNAKFRLKGFKNARKVILAGSFNKWNEHAFKMNKTRDGWELTLQMNPDAYEYRFIVDGMWMEDPDNPSKTENEYGEYNSVLNIKANTTFALVGYHEASEVILSGSFNHWDEHALKMQKTVDGWVYTIPLSGGKHHYKFIVDGNWITDPDNPVREYDGNGHINSVYMVK